MRENGEGDEGDANEKPQKTELSLTVPIVNTTAFLFTVIGEWWVEGKVISRGEYFSLNLCLSALSKGKGREGKGLLLMRDEYVDTMLGMLLCLGGIALCVQSKNV